MLTIGPCTICGKSAAAVYLKPVRNPNPRVMSNGEFGYAGPICPDHTPEEMASAVFRHNTTLALQRPQREIELPHGAGTYRLVMASGDPEPEPDDDPADRPPGHPTHPGDPASPILTPDDPPPMTPAQERMAHARAARGRSTADVA